MIVIHSKYSLGPLIFSISKTLSNLLTKTLVNLCSCWLSLSSKSTCSWYLCLSCRSKNFWCWCLSSYSWYWCLPTKSTSSLISKASLTSAETSWLLAIKSMILCRVYVAKILISLLLLLDSKTNLLLWLLLLHIRNLLNSQTFILILGHLILNYLLHLLVKFS